MDIDTIKYAIENDENICSLSNLADDIYGEYGEVMNIYGAFNQTYSSIEGCKEDAFQYEVYKNADGLNLNAASKSKSAI